jgi:hypothetical protein
MVQIRREIDAVVGRQSDGQRAQDAPHTAEALRALTGRIRIREEAAFRFIRAGEQVLAERRPHRQSLRRPESVLLVSAGRSVRLTAA